MTTTKFKRRLFVEPLEARLMLAAMAWSGPLEHDRADVGRGGSGRLGHAPAYVAELVRGNSFRSEVQGRAAVGDGRRDFPPLATAACCNFPDRESRGGFGQGFQFAPPPSPSVQRNVNVFIFDLQSPAFSTIVISRSTNPAGSIQREPLASSLVARSSSNAKPRSNFAESARPAFASLGSSPPLSLSSSSVIASAAVEDRLAPRSQITDRDWPPQFASGAATGRTPNRASQLATDAGRSLRYVGETGSVATEADGQSIFIQASTANHAKRLKATRAFSTSREVLDLNDWLRDAGEPAFDGELAPDGGLIEISQPRDGRADATVPNQKSARDAADNRAVIDAIWRDYARDRVAFDNVVSTDGGEVESREQLATCDPGTQTNSPDEGGPIELSVASGPPRLLAESQPTANIAASLAPAEIEIEAGVDRYQAFELAPAPAPAAPRSPPRLTPIGLGVNWKSPPSNPVAMGGKARAGKSHPSSGTRQSSVV